MYSILSARSDFSLGESILTVDQVVEAAKTAGQSVVGMTDTMSITGLIGLSDAAAKAGIKPLVGTRLRLSDDPTWRPGEGEKKKHMPPEHYLTVYARTEAGMKAIFRMLTLANSEARYYYTSKLGYQDLYDELDKLHADDLAIMLGDEFSVMQRADIDTIVARLKPAFFDVYAPLVPVATPYYGRMNEIALDLIKRHKLLPLVVRPSFYDAGHADAQEIMRAIVENVAIADGRFKSRYNRDLHPMSLTELVAEIKTAVQHLTQRGTPDAMESFKDGLRNTKRLADSISYAWSKQPVSLPVMAPDEYKALVALCQAGWKTRFSKPVFGHKPSLAELSKDYLPRLTYELDILKRLNFAGYFLLVQDIVSFAKSSGIMVGPGRGSVGGSLVAYLIGITECDPIRFNLLFERFINPDRIDLPDADLDFMSARRHEIVTYLIGKYGEAHVAGVSNFGTLAAASVMRNVGRVADIPEKEYAVSKLVPKLHGANVPLPECRKQVPEIDAFACNHAGLWPVMERIEGTIRNMAQHAAGVVVAAVELVDRGVVERRKETSVMCWDKEIVENQGLVKVDLLGLSTLDVMNLALEYIKERHGTRIDLNSIALDDPEVLENFAHGRTTGVFQFESYGMRNLLREIGSTGKINFEEITAATALYRPGPMESGMMESFYKRKQGSEVVAYDHPLMEPILEPTYGVIVYQEQVMAISRVIAGYNGAEADKLRKIMGKKKPEEMRKERQKFVDGCIATIGATDKWAGDLFDMIEGFAGYGFNRSHSIEYSLISYQSMWLKTRYPVEFFAAGLTLMDEDKLPALLRDARRAGIDVDVPDINHSTGRFEIVTDTRLVIPFQRIKGLSEITTTVILEARASGPFTSVKDFVDRVERRKCNVRHQEILNKIGAFATIQSGLPANDPSRIRDQLELIPGLITDTVPIDRDMHRDKATRAAIEELVMTYRINHGPGSENADGMPIKPQFGKQAAIMVINDAPNGEEDTSGVMGTSRTNGAVLQALEEAGLSGSQVYWTSLIKRPKRGSMITPEEVERYAPYLAEEIRILAPPVIVLLGTMSVRHFIPDLRGKVYDVAGKVVYNRDLDANLVIGFSPGEIFYSPDKQSQLDLVFATVAELLT